MNIDLNDEAAGVRPAGAAGLRVRRRRRAGPGGRGRSRPTREQLVDAGPRRARRVGPRRPRPARDELEAAAALCRSAGYWAAPYPVAERLARPTRPRRRRPARGGRRRVRPRRSRRDSTCAGPRCTSTVAAASSPAGRRRSAPRKSAFVADLELDADRRRRSGRRTRPTSPSAWCCPCWTLLGMLDRAIELTCGYVLDREQFGQPLASFQGVQFQLTDAEVERSGRGGAGEVRAVERRRAVGPRRSRTRWPCGSPRSRRPTSCSGSPTSSTARSASATRPRCRGCPGTASRCAGCRSAWPATRDELTRRIGPPRADRTVLRRRCRAHETPTTCRTS